MLNLITLVYLVCLPFCSPSSPLGQGVIKFARLLFLLGPRTTDTRLLNPKFFAAQIQIPVLNKYLGFWYKGLVFCRNNGWLMENTDKGLTVSKWVLINWPKIPPNAPKFIYPSAQPKSFNLYTRSYMILVTTVCIFFAIKPKSTRILGWPTSSILVHFPIPFLSLE